MTLSGGTRLGPYEVLAPLGAGGMGEVYRAADSRLSRDVALKVLPEEFFEDGDRVARFEREAKSLAALNHPGIAAVYSFEEISGRHILVMELVEGEGLDEKIASGPLPPDESLAYARQIAEALEAAHEKGIVHRDLKPANVKVTPEGKIKLLDFGLAKIFESDPTGSSPSATRSPTLTGRATAAGMILGTAAYMSPEQARGRAVDKRSDVWAFGCVLYEMLTGKRLFIGETVSDTLAAVLRHEISLNDLPPAVPSTVRRLMVRCLERDPKNRLRDIGEARIVLDEVASGRVEETDASLAGAAEPTKKKGWLPWALAGIAIVAAVALAIVQFRAPRSEPAQAIRFDIARPESSSPTNRGKFFELSPDGRFLAIVEAGELWVRPLDSVSARRIEGIEDATYPFWSPDSAWIGFFAENELRKVARDGGRAQKICAAPGGRGASWSADGVILFSDRFGNRGLSRVSAQGGVPAAVTRLATEAASDAHRYPQFLPDGKSFLFLYLAPSPEVAGVYLGKLDGGPPERVLKGSDQAVFARAVGSGSGYLLHRRETTLMAQSFDFGSRRKIGEEVPVANGVGVGANTGSGAFTLSANGLLAFSADAATSSEFVWIGSSGERGERLGSANAEMGDFYGLSLARGGRRLAFGAGNPPDIFTQSLSGGEPSRFTFGPAPGWAYPIWSPDGSEIVYTTQDLVGLPQYEIRRRRADRAGGEEMLLSAKSFLFPWDWSPDGGSILYGDDRGDLWLLPLAGKRKPVAFITAPGQLAYAQFSPDGRLVAYASDEQGQFQVFVATVPPSGALWQISTGGGSMPRWRRDGRELYYRSNDGTLMAVALGAGPGTAAIEERSAPRPLFTGIPSSGNSPIFTYAPDDDGHRFLVASTKRGAQEPITLLVNWPTVLARRAHDGAS